MAPAEMELLQQAGLDARVLLFALVTTGVTGLLFGLAPALKLGNADLRAALTEGGRGSTGVAATARLKNVLVAAELAMAKMLVVGAGLLVRSFAGLTRADPGCNEANLLAFEYSLPIASYDQGPPVLDFYARLTEELAAQPGVRSVTASTSLPFGPELDLQFAYEVLGRVAPLEGAEPQAYYRVVMPGFFRHMGIPMIAGREFETTDGRDAPLVAVRPRTTASFVVSASHCATYLYDSLR